MNYEEVFLNFIWLGKFFFVEYDSIIILKKKFEEIYSFIFLLCYKIKIVRNVYRLLRKRELFIFLVVGCNTIL